MTLLLLILAGCLFGGAVGVYGLSAWWTHTIIMADDGLTAAWLVIATIIFLSSVFELFTIIKTGRSRP